MQKVKIAIVYHSRWGHTRAVAIHLAASMCSESTEIHLVPVEEASEKMQLLHDAHTIVFGCPTYFGNVSAGFKEFMEHTASFWYQQKWNNKLSAGFTNSSTASGDKLNTLIALSLFAAQHGMTWISQGVLPRFINDQQTDGQNRLGSYLGLMTQSDNNLKAIGTIHPGDSLTTELFAQRIVDTTVRYTSQAMNNKSVETIK